MILRNYFLLFIFVLAPSLFGGKIKLVEVKNLTPRPWSIKIGDDKPITIAPCWQISCEKEIGNFEKCENETNFLSVEYISVSVFTPQPSSLYTSHYSYNFTLRAGVNKHGTAQLISTLWGFKTAKEKEEFMLSLPPVSHEMKVRIRIEKRDDNLYYLSMNSKE